MVVVCLNKMKAKSDVVLGNFSFTVLIICCFFFNGESDQMLRNLTLANKKHTQKRKESF